MRHYAGLNFGLWSCSVTANSAQETTMAKHGSLPQYIYQQHCIRSDQPINITFEEADQDKEDGEESEGPGEDSQN